MELLTFGIERSVTKARRRGRCRRRRCRRRRCRRRPRLRL
jgi:hypothetical protein